MSNNKNRRLNPIAAANAKRNKSLWTNPQTYGVLAVGAMIGAAAPSIAATVNPFSGEGSTTTTETRTITSNPSSATQDGLDTVKNDAADANNGGVAGGVVAGDAGGGKQDYPGGPTIDSDVIEAAATCADPNNPDGLKTEHTKVVKERQELVVTTVDVDTLFNMDPKDPNNAAASGCFAAAQQILDLSVAIPSIPTSWGDIGNIVTSQVTARLAQMQQEILDKGCKIGLNALENTLSPLKGVLDAANGSTLLNDPAGFVGSYIAEQVGSQLDSADLAFNGILDDVSGSLEESNRAARDLAAEIAQNAKEIEAPGSYDIGKMDKTLNDGTNSILTGGVTRAQAELDRVIQAAPAQPLPVERDRNGDTIYPVTKNGVKSYVHRTQYWSLQGQYEQYRPNIDAARARLEAANNLLSAHTPAAGSSSPAARSTTNYSSSASLNPTVVPNAVQPAPTVSRPAVTTPAPAAQEPAPATAATATDKRNPFS